MKYDTEQVMAAVEALAGLTDKPVLNPTTAQIAEQCRRTAGVPWRESAAGDVGAALKKLVAEGRLVTYRASGRYSAPRSTVEDESLAHLAKPGNHTDRFYATPANAAALKQQIARQAAELAAADAAADELQRVLNAERLISPRWEPPVRVTHDGKIMVTLTVDQASWLAGRLSAS